MMMAELNFLRMKEFLWEIKGSAILLGTGNHWAGHHLIIQEIMDILWLCYESTRFTYALFIQTEAQYSATASNTSSTVEILLASELYYYGCSFFP